MKRLVLAVITLLVIGTNLPAGAVTTGDFQNGSVYATITADQIRVGNALVERTWSKVPFRTLSIVDKRGGNVEWATGANDFSLTIGATDLPDDLFEVSDVTVEQIAGGLHVDIELTAPGITATRSVEVFNGVAGFATETTLHLTAPLAVGGYTTEAAAVGATAAPTIHAFRAGADWREPGWEGPQAAIGDKHAGTWHVSETAAPGSALNGPAQWISMARDGRSLFIMVERNDQPSTVASYDGTTAEVSVDFSRDIVSAGPFEEDIHAENPTDSPGRHHVIGPGDVALEPTFLGLGRNADDEPWQFFKYLTEHRLEPYDFDVTFNSNGTDMNQISTGAKDDMNYETVLQVAPIAKRLGIDTFILDDGWQAISGDWYPDSPEYPEPRWDGDPNSKFRPRFPDSTFAAVREAIFPMKLGLWMNPMHFNHNSVTFTEHPEWGCAPVGDGLILYNAAQPDSSSNEAGLATWGPDAIPHIEARIIEAITNWGVRYFKFDFLVWLDCAGQGDMYDYRDAFVAMVDRLQVAHPEVTFEVDETNDYRLFPFESVTRGPSWFQNGSPTPSHLLHNIWNLSPYVPAFSLGQHFLGGRAYNDYPVDTLMAVALTSHLTFFSDLRDIPLEIVDQAAPWVAYYQRNRSSFTNLIYPLLTDPVAGGWTALQSWDPEEGSGALLAFRQGSDEASQTIALRNVPEDRTFDLYLGVDETLVGTFTSQELTDGIPVTLGPDGAAVYLIKPHED